MELTPAVASLTCWLNPVTKYTGLSSIFAAGSGENAALSAFEYLVTRQ
jgi:hypothetical protein